MNYHLKYKKYDSFKIPQLAWHPLINDKSALKLYKKHKKITSRFLYNILPNGVLVYRQQFVYLASYASRAVVAKKVFNWGDNDYLGTLLNKAFSDTDPDDLIYPHVNKSNYQSYLQASQKIIELKKQIVNARKIFIKAVTSEEFKFVLESDFDIALTHDEEDAATEEEFKKALLPQI